MKTIYITESQRNRLGKSISKTGRWDLMLNEETGTDRKKVMKIIADNCNETYCKPYLMTPLSDVPDWLHNMCNPAGQEQGAWVSVKNNQHGMNRFIDFLVLNLKGQVGISHGNGPEQYIVGIARVLCQDLGFYSFGANINGGGIIGFSKLMKLIDKMPEFMLDGEVLDKNLNGLTYEELMEKFAPRMEVYRNEVKERLGQGRNVEDKHYKIIAINDTVNNQGMVEPDDYGKRVLDMLDNYTDWCICGQFGLWEYAQYLSNGGKLYILMQDGFRDIPKERGENCPLDEYGLSLIALIVGTDGLPDNVTTRWNHEFGGENHNNMWNAEQIQELTGINYLATFKPRSAQQLRQMHLAESKIPAAQDQVHNKVNAGIMDAVTAGGMMEEGQGNLETWYRGYNTKYGSDYDHLLWLTDDINYARAYGNRVEEVVLDGDKLNSICVSDLLDDGIDYIDGPSKRACKNLTAEGYNCYYFEANDDISYCICLWDKSAIVSRRELSKEEFDKIEGYEGYDNPSYDDVLNEDIENSESDLIHSDEFKEWFGDWENNPESASKVVDENGFPLVVHHGSPKFQGDTFDKKYIGHSINQGEPGIFCTTADYNWAKRFSYPATQGSLSFLVKLDYSKPGDILSGFLNMRHPLDFSNLTDTDIMNIFKMNIKYDEFGKAFVDKMGVEKYCEKFISNVKEALKYNNHQLVKHYIRRNTGEALKEFGYDGYIAIMDNHDENAKEYCFLEPSQFKSIRKLSLKEKEPEMINENSNDRKVNKYIKEKFGLTDFQDIRNKVMEIYEAIPYARVDGGKFMLGVMRILFEEGLPRDEYSVLNKILYKIANSNYYERQGINDPNLGGKTFEELKEKYFVPDFEGTEFSTSEKMIKLGNGYTVTRIDSYDEMNARCDGEWCISYDDCLWYELAADGTVYLVENEELINKHDEAMEDKEYANQFDELCYISGEEDDMNEMGLINDDLSWVNKPGSWKFPYDYYGLSRFVVIVYKSSFVVYSRYNMPNEFDGDYLTKGQLEKLLGIKFEDVFKFIPGKDGSWEYDEFGRKVPFGTVHHEMDEGAEPETDEYKIGGEGGNNEYFHAVNESKIGNFDFKKYFKPIAEFMREDGLNVYPYPKVKLNWEPQDGLFIKTGYYEPDSKTIVIFCDDRHPKDILRTFCHEMIHHSQNLDGVDLNFTSNDDVKDNERLEEIESEAYLKGNVYFRKWTEYQNKNNDLLQEGKERKNDKGEVVPEKCDKCGGDVVCQIHGEPVFVCKDCGKYFGTMPFSLNESIDIKKALVAQKERRDPDGIENIYEDTNPEDIDLSSFNIKTALNPKFWKDGRLDSRIRMRLLDIADDFVDFLGIDIKPEDVIMTGSLANYNWNKKYSDVDLHVVIDFSKIDERTDFVKRYFDAQKNLWNESHPDLTIFGFHVELYAQDANEKHSSTGVYSLDKDKWIKEPDRNSLKSSKINKEKIKNSVKNYIEKIDKLHDIYKGADLDSYDARKASEMAEELWSKIKSERKDGLSSAKNEITNGNIIYKCLRRMGYLDKLFSLRDKSYDKLNSMNEELNENNVV